jgi:threonine aldolase
MGNLVGLMAHVPRGGEIIGPAEIHAFSSEAAGHAVVVGASARGIEPADDGTIDPAAIRAAVRDPTDVHEPITALITLENTHSLSMGQPLTPGYTRTIASLARELELPLFIDGARLFNAAVASSEEPSALAGIADTVTICFSKGLGCPFGAIVAGSSERMLRARRLKHQFGGAMRQAGIAAAACVYALDHHVERLADDHDRARRLAGALHDAGLPVDLAQVETNFVQIDVGALGLGQVDALERLRAEGVRLSATSGTKLRAVTHLDVTDEDIERAVELIPRALGVLVEA